jgi:hypothetical protein
MKMLKSNRNVFAFPLAMCGALLFMQSAVTLAEDAHPSPTNAVDSYNYVIGTQTFGPTYQFTHEDPLLETAQAIQKLGSTVIKFGLHRGYAGYEKSTGKMGNVHEANPNIHSLTELVRDEPTHRKVLDMPFSNYVLWAHTFANDADWRNGFPEEKQRTEYKEMYDLTHYLLTEYNNTGKTFFLGHWEGDGWLRNSVKPENDILVTPARTQAMIDWLNTRQRAIDDAKRDTPHQNVQVWHYTEVNHVKLAMEGRPALVNKVLPFTHVDYVSYSSYDTAYDPELLKKALSFIESQLPAKEGFTGKRVFIGEFGFPSIRYSPEQQDHKSRGVLRAALQWGCPFALYWEMYNNEIDPRGQLGFWMIDDKAAEQPIYHTYQTFYKRARDYVSEFQKQHGRLPTLAEYEPEAAKFLD